MKPESEADPRYSRTLGRGFAILELFSPTRPTLGVNEIAHELGLSPATAQRYVTTLAERGYLVRTSSRKYRLGVRVLDLGQSVLAATPISELARPIAEQLRSAAGFTVTLGVLDGDGVIVKQRAASTRRWSQLVPDSSVGVRLPSHCTSLGKVLLATVPDGTWAERLGQGRLAKHGPGTITSRRRLAVALRHVLDRGYATSDEEFWPEVVSVAVPILDDAEEVVAALSLTGHTKATSLQSLIHSGVPQLRGSATRLSQHLGSHSNLAAAG